MKIAAVLVSALCFALTSCGARPQVSEDIRSNADVRAANFRSETANAKNGNPVSEFPEIVNINTASLEELQRLPHVGPALAQKIIQHRQKHGSFNRREQLMLIPGISDVRYRRIRHLIRVK